MFVIPYFVRNTLPSLCAWKLIPITIFLENRGKNLYRLSADENPDDWLEQNGFVKKSSWKDEDYLFVEIDTVKTRCQDFYSFEQITLQQTKGTEDCWRTFFLMKTQEDNDTSLKSWNELNEPEFLSILQKIKTRML